MTLAETRLTESRRLLRRAFEFALGVYSEQEATKADYWRTTDIGALYGHLSHEIEEIQGNLRRGEGDYLLHNAADAVALSVMLLARMIEREAAD